MGCPNLPVRGTSADATERGCLFVAVTGQHAFQVRDRGGGGGGGGGARIGRGRRLTWRSRGGVRHPSQRSLDESKPEETRIFVSETATTAEANFCESVEAGHSNQDESAQISQLLGIKVPPVRMDSQCKYGTFARPRP